MSILANTESNNLRDFFYGYMSGFLLVKREFQTDVYPHISEDGAPVLKFVFSTRAGEGAFENMLSDPSAPQRELFTQEFLDRLAKAPRSSIVNFALGHEFLPANAMS